MAVQQEQEIAVEARACTARTISSTNPPLAVEPTTGEVHLRHHISPSGLKLLAGDEETVRLPIDLGMQRTLLTTRAI